MNDAGHAEIIAYWAFAGQRFSGERRTGATTLRRGMITALVAAHNHERKAAQKLGLKTAFVARPTEYGPLQKYDLEAKGDWDIIAGDFGELAARMGC